MALTRKELAILRRAVSDAAMWEGELVGNPDPAPLIAHRAYISDLRRIVRKLATEAANASVPWQKKKARR